MILISIHPFALRKIFLVVAMLLCFSAFCFADPVLMARRYAPAPVSLKIPSDFQKGPASSSSIFELPGWDTPTLDLPSRQQRLLSFGGEASGPMLAQIEQVANG